MSDPKSPLPPNTPQPGNDTKAQRTPSIITSDQDEDQNTNETTAPLLDVNGQPQHWLVKPVTIKMLWLLGVGVLALVTWLGTTVHPHATFGIEGTLVFFAWYGFVSSVGLVILAKGLGLFFSKKDTYYDK